MKRKTPADKLKELKQKLKEARKGYRVAKYETLQETMENVVEMRSSRVALAEFVNDAGIVSKNLKKLDANWIASAAFTFVIGKEQEGWKAARVAEFLHGFKGVPIEELAEQMRKLGGIEKIMKLAAKEDPRRVKPLGGVKKGGKARHADKKNPFKSAKVRKEEVDEVDEMEDWGTPIPDNNDDHDEGDHSRMTVRISPALRAKLIAIEKDRRVKLISVRIDSVDCLEIEEVRQLVK